MEVEKTKRNKKTGRVVRLLLLVLAMLVLLVWAIHRASSLLDRPNYDYTGDVEGLKAQIHEDVRWMIGDEEAPKDPNIVNVLLIGSDFRLAGTKDIGRGDATLLCSVNRANGTIKLTSFERGIFVKTPGRDWDLLTHAFHYGGPELSTAVISEYFHLDIAGYAHVDCDTFIRLIDAIGGVDIELTQVEIDNMEAWYLLEEGWNHLCGYDTLQYCRLRKSDSDWKRIARQRIAIQAIMNELKSKSLPELYKIAETVLPLVHTNLSKEDIVSITLAAPRFIGKNAEQMTVPDNNNQACNFDYETERLHTFIYG